MLEQRTTKVDEKLHDYMKQEVSHHVLIAVENRVPASMAYQIGGAVYHEIISKMELDLYDIWKDDIDIWEWVVSFSMYSYVSRVISMNMVVFRDKEIKHD